MIAEAVVLGTKGNTARVKSVRKSACASCENCESKGNCHAQLIFGQSEQSVELDVYNEVGAKAGDRVMLESTGASVLLIALCVFVLPVLFSIASYFLSQRLLSYVYAPSISLVVTFVICFVVCAVVCDKYAKNRLKTKIVKIIKESEEVDFFADKDDKENK